MELEEGLEWVDRCLVVKSGQTLTDTEKVLFTAGWLDQKYSEAAETSGFNAGYLQTIGPGLWRNLTFMLGTKVTKKKLRSVIERLASASDRNLEDTAIETDLDLDHHSDLAVLGRRPPIATQYFGYKPELVYLKQCVLETQCVILFGQAGVGKSSLASKLIESLKLSTKKHFDLVIWQSIHFHPNIDSLLMEIFRCLELEPSNCNQDRADQVSRLLEMLNQKRCLLVLDGAEEILTGSSETSLYGENEPYRWFFQEMIGRNHASCLLLITREPFKDLSFAKEMGQAVRIVEISGLGQDASALLEAQGLINQNDEFGYLIHKYRGNPLCLKLVSNQIKRFFGGSVKAFLDCDTTLLGEPLQEALKAQFTRGGWSELQRHLMHYLAHSTPQQESQSFYEVFTALQSDERPISMSEYIAAVDALCHRCLLESIEANAEVRLSLQPVIKKYILSHASGVIREAQAA